MIDTLKQSPVVWVILSVCTIIGIPAFIFAIISAFKNYRKKELSVAKSSIQVVRQGVNCIKKFTMQFDGKSIDDLSITRLAIWNSGNKTIKAEDIASSAPLCIRAKNSATILDAEIIEMVDKTNNYLLSNVSSDIVRIEFEYTEPQDGVVLQVLHTGERDDLFVDCKIKGGKGIKQRGKKNGPKSEKQKQKRRNRKIVSLIFLGFELLLCSFMLLLMVLAEFNVISKEWLYAAPIHTNTIGNRIILILICMTLVISYTSMYIYILRRTLHLKVPPKLRNSLYN